MRDQRDDYSDRRADHRTDQRADHRTEHRADHVANREHGVANPGRREQYDSVYQDMDERRGSRYEARYDSHYDEGEDPVAFVNVIDMDIPFFQLVWLIFKVMLAAIVAAGIIYLLGVLLHWVLSLPQVQQVLPDGANWLSGLFNRG